MKKFLTLVLLASTLVSTAQESVLLRLNYKKGDVYEMTMKQDVNNPQMTMNMTMFAKLSIIDVNKDIYNSQTKFTKIAMNMVQGTNMFTYDSSKDDADLDQTGLMIKSQMAPMLAAVISTKATNQGKVIEAKAVPEFQGSENLGESNVIYPDKPVKVGDTWTMAKEANGINMNFVYKVTSITKTLVLLSLTGEITGLGEGTISGTMNIDRNSGVPIESVIKTSINAGGQDVDTTVSASFKKV